MKTFLPLFALSLAAAAPAAQVQVYFGTGGGDAKGIYRAPFDTETGKLGPPELAAEVGSPGFLAFHPNGKLLYAAARSEGVAGVAAYAIGEGGALRPLNSAALGEGDATHLAVHPSGKLLITAQYGNGTVALFPIGEGGRVGERAQLHRHGAGSGVDKGRQEAAHPHWCGFSPDGRFAFVPDLGMDKIVIYSVDAEKASIAPHGFADAKPGSGPRHMRFSPNGKFIYLADEMAESASVFSYDAEKGTAKLLDTYPALDAKTLSRAPLNAAAEILAHPTGQFVYISNRGHDSVTVYKADPLSGKLDAIQVEPIRGAWPRNIAMDPKGVWLFAAGQDSHTISVFAIDQQSGELTFMRRSTIIVPSPICILVADDGAPASR